VVGGVDPAAGVEGVPVFGTLSEALAAVPAPDLVVVASPTDTHVRLVREAVESTGALVLSEKPLATSVAELEPLATTTTTGIVRSPCSSTTAAARCSRRTGSPPTPRSRRPSSTPATGRCGWTTPR